MDTRKEFEKQRAEIERLQKKVQRQGEQIKELGRLISYYEEFVGAEMAAATRRQWAKTAKTPVKV